MSTLFRIDPSIPLPLYAQLEQSIREAAISGRLMAGHQLPTVRQLAVELKINANTVAKVYATLEREGLLETRRGVGTFLVKSDSSTGKHEHSRRLNEFISSLLSDAQQAGFTLEEIIQSLQSKQGKQ